MAARKDEEGKEIKRVVRRIDGLRKRARTARAEQRGSIRVLNAFEYEIIDRSLEFLRETLNSSQRLDALNSEDDN